MQNEKKILVVREILPTLRDFTVWKVVAILMSLTVSLSLRRNTFFYMVKEFGGFVIFLSPLIVVTALAPTTKNGKSETD